MLRSVDLFVDRLLPRRAAEPLNFVALATDLAVDGRVTLRVPILLAMGTRK